MTKRAIRRSVALAALLCALTPGTLRAQAGISDVIRAGRAHGVELPSHVVAWMASQGADAFEFERVWKTRVEVMRSNRAAFDAGLLQPSLRRDAHTITRSELQAAGAALTGTFRMPILLGRPSDASAPYGAAAYVERMYGPGTATTYSLKSLYAEMSRGAFNFTGTAIGWVPLPSTSVQYYGSGAANPFGDTFTFMAHTVAGADAAVDFGLYDNDGPDGVPNSGDDDGFVDLAAFMFPAVGRECSAGSPGIWAHRWTSSGWGRGYISTADASAKGGFIRIADYIIQGGHYCDGSLQHIGVVAHEAGHGFGLPDLYDTDSCDGSGSCEDGDVGEGVGVWDLMGSGNWNLAHSPAHMSAHSKAFLGWVDVVTIGADTTLTIAPIAQTGTAYRLNPATVPGEYFLLENRQRTGSEAHLRGTGLLIWHVDSVEYARRSGANRVNNVAARKGLDLEEADGTNGLDSTNRGDAGDPWPGSANRTAFTGSTSPNSNTHAAGRSNVTIVDIAEQADGYVTVTVDLLDMVTLGDVDGDGVVSDTDADLVAGYVVGVAGPDYGRIARADADGDGDIDARDAYVIRAFSAGVPTPGFRVGTQVPE